MKKIIFILVMIVGITYSENVLAANVDTYTFDTDESINELGFATNYSYNDYVTGANSYDFFDENGIFNSVYSNNENVYWTKFNSNMDIISTCKWPLYYSLSKETNPHPQADVFTKSFGNAVYENGYLYVMYSRMASYNTEDEKPGQMVIAIGKYDKNGKELAIKEYPGVDLKPNSTETSGTAAPFTSSNCELKISGNNIIAFFGRNMFNSHQSSLIAYFNKDTLEYESGIAKEGSTQENRYRYYNIYNHTISHSLGQRMIITSDGNPLMMEVGDAGIQGSTRGLLLTKIYDYYDKTYDINTLNKMTIRMVHFREGSNSAYGYNRSHQSLGSLVEVNDGYLYIGGMEKTLSRDYSYNVNEEWNIFVQKYRKDYYEKKLQSEMHMLDVPIRSAEGQPTASTNNGRLFLKEDDKDYGMKWLTDFDKQATVVVRAFSIENDNVVILWEQAPLKAHTTTNGDTYYSVNYEQRKTYYMVVDKDTNIIKNPTLVSNVKLNIETSYAYKDGKVYWTESTRNKQIKVNVLKINTENNTKYDYNKDGEVDLLDVKQLFRIYMVTADRENEEFVSKHDINGDGIVDLLDVKQFFRLYMTGYFN